MSETGPDVDLSDLKEFDVPDPLAPRGGCLAALLIIGLGVSAAWTVLNVTAADHFLAVHASPDEYDWQRELARDFVVELPVDDVGDKVAAIEDPARRGAFHQVLAVAADPAQAPAIGAYMVGLSAGYSWRQSEQARAACTSLAAFPPASAAPVLFDAHAKTEGELRKAIAEGIEALPPAVALPAVLAIADPAERGRWHTVLAASGDPEQIDAIVAFVAKASTGSDRRFEAEAASLLAFGEKGTERLKAALQREEQTVVNLAAEALREVNLPFLIQYSRDELTVYAKNVFGPTGLAAAHRTNSLYKQQSEDLVAGRVKAGDLKVTAAQNTDAVAVLQAANARSLRCFQMLKALTPVTDNEDVDFCFIQGLSSFSEPVAKHCAEALQQRLTPDKLIDVLFRFIARKSEFEVREVDIYERMLKGTGAAGAARIGANLERLLEGAGGDPGEVFWIYKRMAFVVLLETGTQAQLPILAKYSTDTESYHKSSRTRIGTTQRTEVKYADEIAKAVTAINERGK